MRKSSEICATTLGARFQLFALNGDDLFPVAIRAEVGSRFGRTLFGVKRQIISRHFKLLIDTTYQRADPEKHRRVLERVRFYKNLRSHLDGVEYTAIPVGTCAGWSGIAAAGIGGRVRVEVPAYGME